MLADSSMAKWPEHGRTAWCSPDGDAGQSALSSQCGDKPPAIVLDVDETSITQSRREYDDLIAARNAVRRGRLGSVGKDRRGLCRADAGREGGARSQLRAMA
jgi:hypothetical protein